MHTRFYTAWAMMLLGSVSVIAQDRVPAQLTLADALRLASERNPDFAAARDAVDAARADLITARVRPNPALTVDSEGFPLERSGDPIPFINNQELTVRIDQEIELAGRRGLRMEGATARVESAEAAARNEHRRLQLQVRRAYFETVLAKADLDVAKGALDEIDRVITLNRARAEQGEISGADLRRVQVERLRFVDDVFNAELALRNAKSALLALLNMPDLSPAFDVTESLQSASASGAVGPAIAASQPLNRTQLQQQAVSGRPDVLAARSEVRRAESETRLQRALRTPNITVGGGYRRDFGTNALVFGATIPLPLTNRNQGPLARAAAEQRIAANRAAAAETLVRLDVQQAVNSVETNQARVQYIEREYLTNARESRDIVLASYKLGAADLIDFLDAQRAFRDTLRTYNRALFQQQISYFELAAALGTPAPDRQ